MEAYSPPGTGGVAAPSNVRKARTGWSFWIDHPVCAFQRWLSSFFLDAQPPLLFQEGNTPSRPLRFSGLSGLSPNYFRYGFHHALRHIPGTELSPQTFVVSTDARLQPHIV